ncbi:MAG: transglycosylase SLT domain-containing protein [Tannerellaceae bacterium]|jgi:membrane-bound lytic murein transglycosylase F|nr:transglycosylase SLT domain-containing protein [Tannerellaceae bacterium]
MQQIKSILLLLLASFFLFFFCTCCARQAPQREEAPVDFPQLKEKGEITAATLYSSTSYFLYRMEPMGYEYERIYDFAKANGLKLNMKLAENRLRLLEMLQDGEADVIAYPMLFGQELKQQFIYCGREELSTQVLVQPLRQGVRLLTDVTELIGKDIYVKAGNPCYDRLRNLDKELGGGIRIHEVEEEDTAVEDLIEKVSTGEIPYTASDDRLARLNKTYYWNIDISLKISFRQRSSWLVRKNTPLLAQAINEWDSGRVGEFSYKARTKRYFELSKKVLELSMPEIKQGHISPYDSLFKKHARSLGWDWRLLASVAYQESHFKNTEISWAGAQGIMGIMPGTAQNLKIPLQELTDPDVCIRAGAEVLRIFSRGLSEIKDTIELIKLTLAAYNAGIGHVYDARRLAGKYGRDPSVWDNNVAEFILLKREPEFYNDSVCRYGYLRGRETYNYVREVLGRYEYYKQQTTHL